MLDALLASTCLAQLYTISFDRPWWAELTVCDASGDYGFGIAHALVPQHAADSFGLPNQRHDDHIKFVKSDNDPAEVDRRGPPHRMPVRQADFGTPLR